MHSVVPQVPLGAEAAVAPPCRRRVPAVQHAALLQARRRQGEASCATPEAFLVLWLWSCLAVPEFVRLRGTGRDEVDNGFRGSPEFQRLLAVPGAAFMSSPNTSTYEIGLDCGSMFTFRGHSTSIMGVRHAVLCILIIHLLPPHLAAPDVCRRRKRRGVSFHGIG